MFHFCSELNLNRTNGAKSCLEQLTFKYFVFFLAVVVVVDVADIAVYVVVVLSLQVFLLRNFYVLCFPSDLQFPLSSLSSLNEKMSH